MRSSDVVSFSRMATLWYQVICAKHRLHNWLLRPRFREGAHVLQIAMRLTMLTREHNNSPHFLLFSTIWGICFSLKANQDILNQVLQCAEFGHGFDTVGVVNPSPPGQRESEPRVGGSKVNDNMDQPAMEPLAPDSYGQFLAEL